MKKVFLIFALLCLSISAQAQIARVFYVPVPPGSCSTFGLYLGADGSFSFCDPTGTVRTLESTAGAAAFDDIASGTNTTAAMVVGTGASLGVSGSGAITATKASGMTTGSILFSGASSLISQDNASLFWDATPKQFYIGPRTGFSTPMVNWNVLGLSTVQSAQINPTALPYANLALIDDTGTTAGLIASYGVMFSGNDTGTTRGGGNYSIEGDAIHYGAGTVSTLGGIQGYAEQDAGTTNVLLGSRLSANLLNGTVSNFAAGAYVTADMQAGTAGDLAGFDSAITVEGGTTGAAYAMSSDGVAVSGGTVTNVYGAIISPNSVSGMGAVTNNNGIFIRDQGGVGSSTNVALNIESQSASGMAIGTGTGVVSLGDTLQLSKPTTSPIAGTSTYFDNSAITAQRKVTLPNADSTTVQPDTGASNNFLSAISASGVISKAQPSYSNISGGTAALPAGTLPGFTYSGGFAGRATAVTDTTMVTPGADSMYRFSATINCTATSAAAVATLNLKYKDTSGTAQTTAISDTCTSLVATGVPNEVIAIRAQASTAVTWGVTITNTPTYDVSVRLEAM